jgi:acyl-CoA dehydrogenase
MVSDMALLTLGGALKRKEMLAARLGDILSELYLLSAALKRWEDEGRQDADFPLLAWCMDTGFNTIEMRFADVFANLPNRIVAWNLRVVSQPLGCIDQVLRPASARAV